MPAIDLLQNKLSVLRERKRASETSAEVRVDEAVDAIGSFAEDRQMQRQTAAAQELSAQLASEEQLSAHSLNMSRVLDLLSDPLLNEL